MAWAKTLINVPVSNNNVEAAMPQLGTIAFLKHTNSNLDFGDGSLNHTIKGYNSTLKYYSKANDIVASVPQIHYTYSYGNIDAFGSDTTFDMSSTKLYDQRISSGLNTITFTTPITADGNTMYCCGVEGGGGTINTTIGDLCFKVNNNWYHLDDMIEANLIEPLIVVPQCWHTKYVYEDILKVLNSTEQTLSGKWVTAQFFFTPCIGTTLEAIKVTTNKAFSTIDGFRFYQMNDCIFCLGRNSGE